MSYLVGPRFVVRELEGYPSLARRGGNGFSLTVIDRAYCSQVLRMWRSEEAYSGGPFSTTKASSVGKMRAEAAIYCAQLNEGDRCTGGPSDPGDSLLSPSSDLPSLSPFDSGCP